MKRVAKRITMHDVFGNPRYRGKHVVLIANKVFTANTGQGVSQILDNVRKKFPRQIPEVAYLPKSRTLILWT